MDSYPKFELGKSRFDLDTFIGRYCHTIDLNDPRTLFVSDQKLKASVKLLEDYKNGNLPEGVDNSQLWEAQKIKQSTVHPDTGEKIFMPFRMSGYVPFNSLVLAGMLMNNPLPKLIFWQWLNQSHNACVNYANRNASKSTDMSRLKKSYLLAVTSAVSIAVGLNLAIKNVKFLSEATRAVLLRLTPLPAVCTASTLNVLFMRIHEVKEGINVIDKSGKVIGNSKLAAKSALKEMAVSRAVLPVMNFTIAYNAITFIEKTSLVKKYPRLGMPLKLVTCTTTFFINLPTSLAIFPQKSKINIENLEPELQKKTDEKVLFFNKGL